MTTNFSPCAGDGVCTKYSSTAHDWANVIAASSASSCSYTATAAQSPDAMGGGVDTYCIRYHTVFDTTILAGAIIQSVIFHGYVAAFTGNITWYAIKSTQASKDVLAVSDYSLIDKGTLYGSVNITGAGAYTITLDNSVINKGGITKFALITSYDYTATDPGSYQNFTLSHNFGEAASNQPYLEVNYIPAGGAALLHFV